MNIIFDPRFVDQILSGEKTSTCRRSDKGFKKDTAYPCKTSAEDPRPFCYIEITNKIILSIEEFSPNRVAREGFNTLAELQAYLCEVYGLTAETILDVAFTVLDFKVINVRDRVKKVSEAQ